MGKIFDDQQVESLKDEAYQTIKGGADLVQFVISKVMENPIKTAGIIALFAVAIGGVKQLKLSDLFEFKK